MDDNGTTKDQGAESNIVERVRGEVSNGADETKNLSGEGSNQPASGSLEAKPIMGEAKSTPSSTPPLPSQNLTKGEDQVRIIEETIVKPPPQKTTSVVPEEKPRTPEVMVKSPEPIGALPPRPNAQKMTPPASIPQTPLSSAALSAKMEVKLEPSPTPKSPAETSPKEGNASSTLPHTSEAFEKEREAISRILEEAKLPERRPVPETPTAPASAPKVFDTALGAEVKPEKEKPIETPKAPTAISASETSSGSTLMSSIVAPLRTLKNDLQDIIRIKKISLVRAAAIESEKKSGSNIFREEIERARSHRTRGIIFASGLFVFLGAAGLFGVYFIAQEHAGIPPTAQNASILFAESTVALPLKNNSPLEIKRTIVGASGGINATLGSITRVVPTVSETTPDGKAIERPATLEEFLRSLGARASPDLIRALSSDFFFGIHTVDKNAPLLVIPVLSYERAFAGMLDWEQTLNADLAPAFTAVPDQVIGTGGLPEKRRFDDVVMRNYDVRALKDDSGGIQLYYSFPTQHLLVIAESPYSFVEILNRLRAEHKL